MIINPEEKRDLKKSSKRLAIFLLLIFIIDGFIAFLFFKYTKIHTALCVFILLVATTIFYLLFLWICGKIDKKREKRLSESGKKDPFTKE